MDGRVRTVTPSANSQLKGRDPTGVVGCGRVSALPRQFLAEVDIILAMTFDTRVTVSDPLNQGKSA